ncbi:T9SS type A sorting domain-containing protein [Ferruginibacter albus]|uniref:T9SS type A sorting domain-containing protein n=1 Tax=Ferruginibacter albus TaxID=2875540 RepID=UPI001CC3B220|nr:T9SS type A sorting domain-containing protein [Ferruginibacter albus]UAY53057.1 T9SS type A sorting domain-containing protein [Ferruginibacter albus]
MKNLILSVLSIIIAYTATAAGFTIKTNAATSVSYITASLGGTITAAPSFTIIERGIVWSTTKNSPTTSDNKIVMGLGQGTWSISSGPFPAGTLVYFRAYAILSTSPIATYGSALTFTTTALPGVSGTYDFESTSGSYDGFDGGVLTASNTATSTSMKISADGIHRASEWVSGQPDHIAGEGLYLQTTSETPQATFEIQGNNTFDLNSFYFANQTTDGITYTFTTSKGSITVQYTSEDPTGQAVIIDIAHSPDYNYFKGIKSFTVTASQTSADFEVDHITLQNIKSNTVLPLRFVSFTGTNINHSASLEWTTANEINTKEMQVETSTDGIHFIQKATITAIGKGNNTYHFSDALDNNAIVYYRIKTVDTDGKTSTSSIVIIIDRADKAQSLELLPNLLTQGNAIIKIKSSISTGKITIYNQNGAVVKQQGWETGQFINTNILSTGSYVLQLSDGKQVLSSRFVKQ